MINYLKWDLIINKTKLNVFLYLPRACQKNI